MRPEHHLRRSSVRSSGRGSTISEPISESEIAESAAEIGGDRRSSEIGGGGGKARRSHGRSRMGRVSVLIDKTLHRSRSGPASSSSAAEPSSPRSPTSSDAVAAAAPSSASASSSAAGVLPLVPPDELRYSRQASAPPVLEGGSGRLYAGKGGELVTRAEAIAEEVREIASELERLLETLGESLMARLVCLLP